MKPLHNVVLLSALLLASCASVAPGSKLLPPEEFMAPCYEPPAAAATNGELARSLRAMRDALRGCNAQLDGIRRWAQE